MPEPEGKIKMKKNKMVCVIKYNKQLSCSFSRGRKHVAPVGLREIYGTRGQIPK